MQVFLPTSSKPLPTRDLAKSVQFVRPADAGVGAALVVDDEELVRRIAVSMLEGQGWHVIEAISGSEGVEALRRSGEQVRFCLLDMTMPGMSGEETLHALRELRPDLPVMLTSGYSEASVARLIEIPRIVFLQKPYRLAQFSSRLRELIESDD